MNENRSVRRPSRATFPPPVFVLSLQVTLLLLALGPTVARAQTIGEVTRADENGFTIEKDSGDLERNGIRDHSPLGLLALSQPKLSTSRPYGDALRRFDPTQTPAGRKSAFAAGALEWFIPLVGHAYAGDVRAGLLPGAVRVGGFAMMVVGAGLFAADIAEGGDDSGGGGLIVGGLLATAAGTIWGTVSAVSTANRHNARLREGGGLANMDLAVWPTPNGVSVGMSVRVF